MGLDPRTTLNIDREMEEIDEAIVTHSRRIEELKCQRFELFAQKQDCEMQDVFECAFENGFTPDEMMKLLENAVSQRKTHS